MLSGNVCCPVRQRKHAESVWQFDQKNAAVNLVFLNTSRNGVVLIWQYVAKALVLTWKLMQPGLEGPGFLWPSSQDQWGHGVIYPVSLVKASSPSTKLSFEHTLWQFKHTQNHSWVCVFECLICELNAGNSMFTTRADFLPSPQPSRLPRLVCAQTRQPVASYAFCSSVRSHVNSQFTFLWKYLITFHTREGLFTSVRSHVRYQITVRYTCLWACWA